MQGSGLPNLLLWPDSALYVGLGFDAELHRHHAVQLCVSLDYPMACRTAETDDWITTHTVAINADQPHELKCRGRVVVLFVATESTLQESLVKAIFAKSNLSVTGLKLDRAQIAGLLDTHPSLDCSAGQQVKSLLLGLHAQEGRQLGSPDSRVNAAIAYITQHLDSKLGAESLAAKVNLSADHLMNLFRQYAGISIRQYVLWARIRCATEAVVNGMSLTDAAHEAGFSDSAHFSHSFRGTFGLAPGLLNVIARQRGLHFCG